MPRAFHLVDEVSAVDHVLGPGHAPVTVVEYGDFECSNCREAAVTLRALLTRFDERVRLVFRHFPQEGAHSHALRAAEAAESAGGQGMFWPMHDLLFEKQLHLDTARLFEYARTLGLEMARFTAEMDDEVYLQRVREHQLSGHDSGVRSAPAFFVNGRRVHSSQGTRALTSAVEAALRG